MQKKTISQPIIFSNNVPNKINVLSIFRSVNSASPPAQGCCGTPTPTSPQDEEKMVEYLKELQAEKESLEALQDGAKTANAIKLIEQGKILKLRPQTTFVEDT